MFYPWLLIAYINITKCVKMLHRNDLLSTYVKSAHFTLKSSFSATNQCNRKTRRKKSQKALPAKSTFPHKIQIFQVHSTHKTFSTVALERLFPVIHPSIFLTFKYLNCPDHSFHCSSHPGHETVKFQVTNFHFKKGSSILNKINSFPHIE